MIALEQALADARNVVAFLESWTPEVNVEPKSAIPDAGLMNPDPFWDHIRGDAGELFPSITQKQVDGINSILAYGAGKLPRSWCAYCLATPYHETGKLMEGVKEGFDKSDAWRKEHLSYYPWYGRGLVQLTWETNYQKSTALLREHGFPAADLIARPDDALRLDYGTVIMIEGMLVGLFTGKKLNDYIPAVATREHYKNARRIINGTDKADLIAGYAVEFDKALQAGEWK